MHASLKFLQTAIVVVTFPILQTISLPLLPRDSKYLNPFVGFYIFPHGGVTLDPINMDYSNEPGFNKTDSRAKAIALHEAMKKSAEALIKSNPDLIIFSTPHGFFLADSPLILSTSRTHGNAGYIWESFTASFDIDTDLSSIIYAELKGAHNPIDILTMGSGDETAPIMWAEVIPWYFIREAAKKAGQSIPDAIYIGQPSRVSINELKNVGRDIVKTTLLRKEFWKKRIAVVVSGDLSHYHSKDPKAPYKYDPISDVFDKFIVNWAKTDRNTAKEEESKIQLIAKAGNIQEQAGHCGYAGFVMMHGMIEELVNQKWYFKSNFYTYQVPSYFGMLVASWTPTNFCKICQ